MSLQWTFIATFLYTEIFLVVLLMLPFISAYRWQKIFRSRLLGSFTRFANAYFYIFILVLVVLFCDSIRDVRRFSDAHGDEIDMRNNPTAETVLNMKMFRAQRNFFIAGGALFLALVLRRIVTLLSNQATLEASNEATKKQAESATAAAQQLIDAQDDKANEKNAIAEATATAKELDTTKSQLKNSKEELTRVTTDLATMKKQATATNNEYDRLMSEHAALQAKLQSVEGAAGGKKDD